MGAWLLLTHGVAVMALPFASLPLPAGLLLAAGILLSLGWYWPRQVSRRAPGTIRTLTWGSDRACHLQLQGGGVSDATLCRQAFVQPWLVILQVTETGRRRRPLVILPDMLDGVTFRRLRVRLKMELGQTGAPG
jgi:hypothetical protein